jgi:hypothetical protein
MKAMLTGLGLERRVTDIEPSGRARLALAAMLLGTALVAATSDTGAAAGQAQRVHAVGVVTETFIDTQRPTAAWG